MKYLLLDSWAGRRRHPVEVIGQTRTKYRVRLLTDVNLPGGRYARSGDVVLVPKHAVIDVSPAVMAAAAK